MSKGELCARGSAVTCLTNRVQRGYPHGLCRLDRQLRRQDRHW